MTVNALFTELQSLLGDAVDPSALRGGADLLIDKDLDVGRLRERFARAIQTVREYDLKRQVWNERLNLWQEIERAKSAIAKIDSLAPPTIDLLLQNTRMPDQGFGDGFEHELPTSIHIQHNGSSTPAIVKRIRCSTRGEPKDSVQVGLAALAVPFGKMNGKTYALGADLAKKIGSDIRQAVEAAKEAKCDVVAFPEYSVPRSMVPELKRLADFHGMVIIGGLEGEWQHGKLYDQAAVFVPGERQVYLQSKQEPSLEEEAGDGFYRDGEIKLFSNSPIGNFVVVVCSDFLQLTTLRSWKDDAELPEIMFVIARNKFHDLYMNFAKTDAVRLYTSVAISNVYDDSDEVATPKGSCVVVPRRHHMEVVGEIRSVSGQFIENLTTYEISLRAIRAKSRGKPDQGYLAVPKSAQRV